MFTYTISEYPNLVKPFAVYRNDPFGNGAIVKTFKTRKGAENWIRRQTA